MSQDAPTFLGTVIKAIACTPNQSFDRASYERDVVAPTRSIRQLVKELDEREPDEAQAREVLEKLRAILEAKKVSPEERDAWMREVLAGSPHGDRLADLVPPPPPPAGPAAADEIRARAKQWSEALQPA